MSLVLLVASCEQSPVKADYDYTFDESQRGFSFSATSQGTSYGVGYEDSIYTINVFRNYTEGDEWLPLQYGAQAAMFELPDSIYFEDGKDVSSFNIDVTGFEPGKTYQILMAFDPELGMAYGTYINGEDTVELTGVNQTLVQFSVEYTWVSKGIVLFVSEWEAARAEVEIQQALEYSDAEGNHYMRLNSPYYYVAPDYCSAAGKHAYFYLDKDYNANNSLVPTGIQMIEDGYGWYWHPNYVGVYNSFVNQGNIYMISVLWYEAASNKLYNPTNEMWQWNIDHYNAAKADPNWKYE